MRADLYKILGVPSDADDSAIKSAYRRLARQFHPDAGEGSSPDTFRCVQDAYETLADPARREAYDQGRASRPAAPRFETAWDIRGVPQSTHVDLRSFSGPGGSAGFRAHAPGYAGRSQPPRDLFDEFLDLLRMYDPYFW